MTLWKKDSPKNGLIQKMKKECIIKIHPSCQLKFWIPIIISWRTFNQFDWKKPSIARKTTNQTSNSSGWVAVTVTWITAKRLLPLSSQPRPLPLAAVSKPCKAPPDSNSETKAANYTMQKPTNQKQLWPSATSQLSAWKVKNNPHPSRPTSKSLELLPLCGSASPSTSCFATSYASAKSRYICLNYTG